MLRKPFLNPDSIMQRQSRSGSTLNDTTAIVALSAFEGIDAPIWGAAQPGEKIGGISTSLNLDRHRQSGQCRRKLAPI